MIEIDFETAVNTLEEVVAGNEALIYERPLGRLCSYATGKNTPGCGVGQMFRRLGVSQEDLIKLDEAGAVESLAIPDTQDIVSFADQRTATFLEWFQWNQDQGIPWGRALASAKKAVEDD